jgi:hypothetical protein
MKRAARLTVASAAVLAMAAIVAAAVGPDIHWPQAPDPIQQADAADEAPASPNDRVAQASPWPAAPAAPVQPPAQQAPVPQAPPAQAPAALQPSVARQNDAEVVFTLVRTAMVALDQADVTGNYTVLRDISAPGFREKHSAADLARIFAPIRDAKIDLSEAVLLDPHISKATVNEQKMLYVVGAFDTKPLPVSFEFLFEPIGGRWRIFGIAVKPIVQVSNVPAPSATAKPPPPKAKRTAAPKPVAPAVPVTAPPLAGNPK